MEVGPVFLDSSKGRESGRLQHKDFSGFLVVYWPFETEATCPMAQCLWSSVAKGPKFRPHNSKGALQKFVGPEKLAAELSFKMPEKGPNFPLKCQKRGRTFLKMIIHIKTFIYLQKSTLHLLISLIFHSLCQEK
jgi:hypothetical protein